ncbi:MAG TPA: cupin domain-containing protein, partial [Aquihabitans sp.]|nr:cupin domain-containing protein [Aquihabitans sp.]
MADIERVTLDNTNFRTVVHTGEHTQLTVMRLAPGEEIGWEAHDHLDQFLRVEQGTGRLDFGRSEDSVEEQHDLADDW